MFRHNLILADVERVASFNMKNYDGLAYELAKGGIIRIGGNGELCTFEATRVFYHWLRSEEEGEMLKKLRLK
jgi:hypothetical protein